MGIRQTDAAELLGRVDIPAAGAEESGEIMADIFVEREPGTS